MSVKDVGITVSKDKDFSELYTQVILKAELADYSAAKGFMVLRPNGYEMWEKIREFIDPRIKKTGHRNAYFPLLIPESLIKKKRRIFEGLLQKFFWSPR